MYKGNVVVHTVYAKNIVSFLNGTFVNLLENWQKNVATTKKGRKEKINNLGETKKWIKDQKS